MSVSVLIPSKNPGHHIIAAVRSAKAQPETLEVLVADAGSTDDSGARALELGATVIQLGDIGQVAARNELAQRAHGDWVQWLDADDYLRPGKFAAQLENTDDVDCSYCDFEAVSTAGRRVRRLAGVSPLLALHLGAPIGLGAYLVRTEIARAVPFDPTYELGGCVGKWALDLTVAGVRFAHVPFLGFAWREGWSASQTTADRSAQAMGMDRIRRALVELGPRLPSLEDLTMTAHRDRLAST